jgi:large subunit ribosomal protein L16
MFIPKKKFIKVHKLKIKSANCKSKKTMFNSVCIKSCSFGFLNKKHIETLRRTIIKLVGKKSKILFRFFPHVSLTKKATSSRMGKGKGANAGYVAAIRPGQVIMEFVPLDQNTHINKKLIKILYSKIPLKLSTNKNFK